MPAKRKFNKDREKDKARTFVFIIYPDDNEKHELVYLALTSLRYSALLIKHDKDVYSEDVIDKETGELLHSEGEYKKPHYHCYLQFQNQRYINGVADELGLEPNLIQFCDGTFKQNAEYFLHWGKYSTPGRYIYEPEAFEGSLKGIALQTLNNEPPELKLHKIYEFIKSCDNFVNYGTVYEWCYASGYSNICTGRLQVVKEFIYSHNEQLAKVKKNPY